MLRVIGCITEHHDPWLVLIAIGICATGSWTSVALLSRARHNDARVQSLWVLAASIVFGLAVWATHFIAMLGFRSSLPVSYDVGLTALSIAAGVGCTWIGLTIAVRTRAQATAGAIVGAAISVMHYIGMSAIEGPFHLNWDGGYVAVSVLGGAGIASLAMLARQNMPRRFAKGIKSTLLALSVCTVHFIGMTAVTIVPEPTNTQFGSTIAPGAIAIAVAAVALLIVVLGLVSANLDLYLELRRNDERKRLKAYINTLESTKIDLGLALEAAYASNKSKSAFLAAMSHELRTPLNAIIGFSELMTSEPFGPLGNDRYKGYSIDIQKSGTRLLEVINNVLDISRLEARKAELIESEIRLPKLLAEVCSTMQIQAAEAGVTVTIQSAPDVPTLWADERRVKQIVVNLLSNGIKFTPAGGRVVVEASLRAGAINIAVRDSGIGMATAEIPKAFESFAQIDNRVSRKYEGCGLGLPLARHLAELHEGSLTIESEVGVGTVATVHFPSNRSIAEVSERVA